MIKRSRLKTGFKKSQAKNAGYAAGLIITIGIIFLLYIFFLPPEARNDILNQTDNGSSTSDGSSGALTSGVLLRANPGMIVPKTTITKYSEGHSLSDVRIEAVTEAKLIKKEPPFTIRSNIFSTTTKTVVFSLSDINNTDNIILSFTSSKHKGILKVLLNGYEIFNYEMTSPNIEPIELDKGLLKEDNVLEFVVSKGFLSSNYYNIENMKITAYVKNLENSKALLSFQINPSELESFESAKLTYAVRCYSSEKGKLSININGYDLGSFVPDCDSFRKIEFPAYYLTPGQNFISFETTGGIYLIYQIRVTPEFKDINAPTYYFELKPEDYEDILNDEKELVLKMRFPDLTLKEAKVYVNGYVIGLSTRDLNFETVIDKDYLFNHTNSLKIEPSRTMEITELTLELRDKET